MEQRCLFQFRAYIFSSVMLIVEHVCYIMLLKVNLIHIQTCSANFLLYDYVSLEQLILSDCALFYELLTISPASLNISIHALRAVLFFQSVNCPN